MKNTQRGDRLENKTKINQKKTMSDTELARESLPSISDLSLNPQTVPGAKPATTEGKPKKDVEKGMLCATMPSRFFFKWKFSHNHISIFL